MLAEPAGVMPAGPSCPGVIEGESSNMSIKQQLEKQLEKKLEKWRSEIEEAEARAKAEEAEAAASRAEAETEKALWSKADDLKRRVDRAEKRLAELKDAGEGRLRSLKDEIQCLVA